MNNLSRTRGPQGVTPSQENRAKALQTTLTAIERALGKDITRTVLIFINRLRMKIGVMFGNPETTAGGNALKFYASVRLDVRGAGNVKEGEVLDLAVDAKCILKTAAWYAYQGEKIGQGREKAASWLQAALPAGSSTNADTPPYDNAWQSAPEAL